MSLLFFHVLSIYTKARYKAFVLSDFFRHLSRKYHYYISACWMLKALGFIFFVRIGLQLSNHSQTTVQQLVLNFCLVELGSSILNILVGKIDKIFKFQRFQGLEIFCPSQYQYFPLKQHTISSQWLCNLTQCYRIFHTSCEAT